MLYVEAQKHGVHAWPYAGHGTGSVFDVPDGPLMTYRYKGVAEDPEKASNDNVGYDLLPIYSTFWKRARGLEKPDQTYGEILDFGRSRRFFNAAQKKAAAVRDLTCQFADCDQPIRYTQYHHCVPFSEGGLTDTANAAPACPKCRSQDVARVELDDPSLYATEGGSGQWSAGDPGWGCHSCGLEWPTGNETGPPDPGPRY